MMNGQYPFCKRGNVLLMFALLMCFAGCGSHTPMETPSSTREPIAATCPWAILYQGEYYYCQGERTGVDVIDGAESVGAIESRVSIDKMPEEELQINGENFVGNELWYRENVLYLQAEEGQYFIFERKS